MQCRSDKVSGSQAWEQTPSWLCTSDERRNSRWYRQRNEGWQGSSCQQEGTWNCSSFIRSSCKWRTQPPIDGSACLSLTWELKRKSFKKKKKNHSGLTGGAFCSRTGGSQTEECYDDAMMRFLLIKKLCRAASNNITSGNKTWPFYRPDHQMPFQHYLPEIQIPLFYVPAEDGGGGSP